ncbi:ATP-binding protein [Ralstonia pseudosolanacearum]|uniref:ATP-binding protein n=1 Tax=Ralstonia pseudosolanacearum TaxID=1310165 RepID=UPI003CF894B1
MTLFVAGVHAVGKTFVLKPVCESLGVRHATASQLIREQRGLASWTVSRQVDDIDENQRALIAAVHRLEQEGQKVVLDGHFVLRRAVGVHEQIGLEIYEQLMLHGVLLLEAEDAVIAERLLLRGDDTWSHAEIEVFAQKELQHAEFVCRQLGIPFVRLSSPSEEQVREAVAKLFG